MQEKLNSFITVSCQPFLTKFVCMHTHTFDVKWKLVKELAKILRNVLSTFNYHSLFSRYKSKDSQWNAYFVNVSKFEMNYGNGFQHHRTKMTSRFKDILKLAS